MLSQLKQIGQCLVAFGALSLAGCGFEPIYAKHDDNNPGVREHLESVAIDTPPGRQGELLYAELKDHFNPESDPSGADYTLKAGLETHYQPFIIESDGTAARYNILIKSPFTLVRNLDGKAIQSGTISRQVSYNVSESDDYATFVTQNDTLRRGIVELAEDYKMRVSAALKHEQSKP